MARRVRWTGILLILWTVLTGCRQDGPSVGARSAFVPAPPPAGARVTGEVKLAGSDDAGGIQVYIPGTRYFAITDARGAFTIDDLGAGDYKIMARAAGYLPTTVTQSLPIAAADLGHEIRLESKTLSSHAAAAGTPAASILAQRFGAIEGRVRIVDESPSAASQSTRFEPARVELEGTSYSTVCREDGSFLLWNLPADQYRLTARSAGALSKTVVVRVLPGEKGAVDIRLVRGSAPAATGRIAGSVELYDVQGARTNEFDRITVRLLGASMTTGLNPDGSFVFTELPRDRYKVTAGGEGFGQSNPVDADLTSRTEINLVLTLAATEAAPAKTGRIAGLAIKGKRGETDHSGIAIALTGTQATASTGDDGHYTLDKLPPGTYRLVASAPGFKSARIDPIEVKPGEETKVDDIVLDPEREAFKVVATAPADGTKGVLILRQTPVSIRFNRKADIESLRQAIRIDPPVAFRVEIADDGTGAAGVWAIMTLSGAGAPPTARFRTDYRVTIAETAASIEGDPMEGPYRFGFTTGDPAVIATDPADNGAKSRLGPDSPVMVFFDAAMDARTLSAEALRIVPALATIPQVQAYTDPATGWTRMSVTAIWAPDTEYKVTVLARARTAGKDALMNVPYTFRFKTAKLVPLTGPLPNSPSP